MKVSIKFSLAPGKASDLPIRIRVSYDGLRVDLRTGYVCPPDCWDAATMRMAPGTRNRYGERAALVNAKLSKQEADMLNILTKYELEEKTPDPSLLKDEFSKLQGRKTKSDTGNTFASLSDVYMRECSRTFQSSTVENLMSMLAIISREDFARIPVDSITENMLYRYVDKLISSGMQNPTIDAYVVRIKTVLRWAYRKGHYNGKLHETFQHRLKSVKKDVPYLEWSEFLALYHMTTLRDYQEIARDMFCLCCTTGLRVSDCEALSWNDITMTDNGGCIHLVAKKTKKQTIIELNDYSHAILLKYEHRRNCKTVFPCILLRHRSDLLKMIAHMAGLTRKVRKMTIVGNRVTETYKEVWEVISSHWGRHTFIVRALSLGISPAIVMSWTGHASFESMKPYVQIASAEKAQNMSLFNMPEKAPEKNG